MQMRETENKENPHGDVYHVVKRASVAIVKLKVSDESQCDAGRLKPII